MMKRKEDKGAVPLTFRLAGTLLELLIVKLLIYALSLGLTNTVTAVKNAQMAESPLLLMGGAAATLLKVRLLKYHC